MSEQCHIDVELYLSAVCRTFRRYVRSLAPDTGTSILGSPTITKTDIQRQVGEWKKNNIQKGAADATDTPITQGENPHD